MARIFLSNARAGMYAWFGLACLVAIWPMFYNRFPLVYDDTGVYLGSPGHLYPPFPHFYTAFVFVVRRAASIQAVPVLQALLTVGAVTLALAKLSGSGISWSVVAAVVLVLAATQLPWLVSTIMPDFLLGIGLVALLTLLLKFRDLGLIEKTFLFLIAVVAAVCATANAIVMVVFAPLVLGAARLLDGRAGRARMLAAAAFAALAIFLPIAANAIIFHRPTYAIGSSARLFSKLVDKGLAVPFLERECGSTHYVACDFLPQIRNLGRGEDFLWAGVAEDSGAWLDRTGDFGRLNMAIISAQPRAVAALALGDVLTLFGRPTLFSPEGREIVPHRAASDTVYKNVLEAEPDALPGLLAARQQNESLAKNRLDRAYGLATLLSAACALISIIFLARARDRELVTISLLLIIAIVISTCIHGALSSPVARYLVKVSWLLWLIPMIALLHALANRRKVGSLRKPDVLERAPAPNR